jgi:hypothetical protein
VCAALSRAQAEPIGSEILPGFLSNKIIRILIKRRIQEPPYHPHYALSGVYQKVVLGSETSHAALRNKNMRIPLPKKNGDPPSTPHYAISGRSKGGIFESCLRFPKLQI